MAMKRAVFALVMLTAFVAFAQTRREQRDAMLATILGSGTDGHVLTKDSAELGTVKWAAAGGGCGSGAPTDAVYFTGATNASLSAERVVTDTGTVAWDLGTPGQARASVVAGGVGASEIADGNVTLAKMANIAQHTVLGRNAASDGAPEAITVMQLTAWPGMLNIDYLAADHANSTTTPTTIPDISIAVAANVDYVIECRFLTSAAAATTGVQITIVGPASPADVAVTRVYPTTATAVGRLSTAAFGALNATASQGNVQQAEEIVIVLRNGANAGSVTFQLDSEVAASLTTVHDGSHCQWRQLL